MLIKAGHILGDEWDTVVRHAPLGQFWHWSEWRQYSMDLAGPGAVDDSFGVYRGGKLEAVCVLVWEPATQRYTLGGEPGPLPASWSEAALGEALEVARDMARGRGVPLTFRLPAGKTHGYAAEKFGWVLGGWQTRIVHLSPARAILWRAVRKSYHSLIHRAERSHAIVLSCGDGLLAEYQALHQKTAGQYLPRPDSTYEWQGRWLREGKALLLGAQDRETHDWDGFAYLFLHQGHAYYGSGPSAPGRTVMHALQWAAIMACQMMGLQTYEVGWQGHATESKGQGIEQFKRGFGGHDVPLATWEAA